MGGGGCGGCAGCATENIKAVIRPWLCDVPGSRGLDSLTAEVFMSRDTPNSPYSSAPDRENAAVRARGDTCFFDTVSTEEAAAAADTGVDADVHTSRMCSDDSKQPQGLAAGVTQPAAYGGGEDDKGVPQVQAVVVVIVFVVFIVVYYE